MADTRRKVGNLLALFVLAELMAGPKHPYELGRLLAEHGKDRSVKYTRSTLYTVVEQLVGAGFIVERETLRDTARPERTVYGITETGRSELRDWLCDLVATPRPEYPSFGAALSLIMVLAPAEAVDMLRRRLMTLDRQANEIRGTLDDSAGVEWVFLVDEQFRLEMLDTERRFVAHLIDSLAAPEYDQAWLKVVEGFQT
ncbi:PadR family transcriptional regulator [Nocardia sp. NPDC059239]|uniref:PadR family transcriptional regulator n=1 Tax=unclassified Nocardia TaxID=2637762 RepID=UPI0036A3E66C